IRYTTRRSSPNPSVLQEDAPRPCTTSLASKNMASSTSTRTTRTPPSLHYVTVSPKNRASRGQRMHTAHMHDGGWTQSGGVRGVLTAED
ncbi:hypothetical protein B0H17DRAFT_1109986, partial [Mycena rosella]